MSDEDNKMRLETAMFTAAMTLAPSAAFAATPVNLYTNADFMMINGGIITVCLVGFFVTLCASGWLMLADRRSLEAPRYETYRHILHVAAALKFATAFTIATIPSPNVWFADTNLVLVGLATLALTAIVARFAPRRRPASDALKNTTTLVFLWSAVCFAYGLGAVSHTEQLQRSSAHSPRCAY